MGVDERLPPAKMPIRLLWCSQPGIGDGQCLTLLQDTAGYALLNSPPCFGQAPAGGSSKWIPGQGGEGQILGCKVAGELVVKHLSQGGGTTCEPTLQILSTCSIVMDFIYKTQVET